MKFKKGSYVQIKKLIKAEDESSEDFSFVQRQFKNQIGRIEEINLYRKNTKEVDRYCHFVKFLGSTPPKTGYFRKEEMRLLKEEDVLPYLI